jgi:hypothetical protein
MPRMRQCPTCGSKLKKENYQKRIKKKRLSRDKITLSLIDDSFESISKYFSMDDLDKFSFLKNVEEITDIVVRKMIRQYLQEKFYKRGYGIKYLIGMIKTENSAYGLKKEYERKSLDRIPPKVDK